MSRKTAKLKRKIQKINEALEIFTEMYGWCYFNRLTAGKTVKDFYGSLCSPDIEKEVDSCLVESINEGVIGHSDNNISWSFLKYRTYQKMKLDIKKYIELAKLAIEYTVGNYPVILFAESSGFWGGRRGVLRIHQ